MAWIGNVATIAARQCVASTAHSGCLKMLEHSFKQLHLMCFFALYRSCNLCFQCSGFQKISSVIVLMFYFTFFIILLLFIHPKISHQNFYCSILFLYARKSCSVQSSLYVNIQTECLHSGVILLAAVCARLIQHCGLSTCSHSEDLLRQEMDF